MTQLVKIENQSIAVKEYKGQKVVTFKDIDAVHGRAAGTARRNFNANRRQFAEDKDFYHIKALDEIRSTGLSPNPNGIIVLTETGYLMLAKSLTDDLAWKVQRKLVENYFHAPCQPIQQQMKLDEPWCYEYKTWHGVQVVTLRDIAVLTGTSLNALQTYMGRHRKDFKPDEAQMLAGDSIREFREENPNVYMSRVLALWVLTAKGAKKLVVNPTKGMTIWQERKPRRKPKEFDEQTSVAYIQSEARAIMHLTKAIEAMAMRVISATAKI